MERMSIVTILSVSHTVLLNLQPGDWSFLPEGPLPFFQLKVGPGVVTDCVGILPILAAARLFFYHVAHHRDRSSSCASMSLW